MSDVNEVQKIEVNTGYFIAKLLLKHIPFMFLYFKLNSQK